MHEDVDSLMDLLGDRIYDASNNDDEFFVMICDAIIDSETHKGELTPRAVAARDLSQSRRDKIKKQKITFLNKEI